MIHVLFLLIHLAQSRYRVTAARGGWREHTCIHCGCRFQCRKDWKVIGAGHSLQAAHANAGRLLQRSLTREIARRPCPTCGLYQPDMVGPFRFKFHLFVFLGLAGCLFFVVLLVRIALALASEAPVFPLVASCIALAVIVTGWLAHLVIDIRNPNRSVLANLEIAQANLRNGKLRLVAAGDELLAKDPPAAAGWRPPGQFALHGVMFLALVFVPIGEMLRLIKGWQINSNCDPVVAGPGDSIRIQFPKRRITTVKGNWYGEGRAEILNADDLGVPTELRLASCHDSWGEQIKIEHEYDTHTVRYLWAQVELPDDPQLGGKIVQIKMDLDITHPKWKPGGFENTKETATHTATVAVASERKAFSTYRTYFNFGGLGGSVLALIVSCLLTFPTIWVRSRALPSELYLDPN